MTPSPEKNLEDQNNTKVETRIAVFLLLTWAMGTGVFSLVAHAQGDATQEQKKQDYLRIQEAQLKQQLAYDRYYRSLRNLAEKKGPGAHVTKKEADQLMIKITRPMDLEVHEAQDQAYKNILRRNGIGLKTLGKGGKEIESIPTTPPITPADPKGIALARQLAGVNPDEGGKNSSTTASSSPKRALLPTVKRSQGDTLSKEGIKDELSFEGDAIDPLKAIEK